jgi:hypothetical protein
MLASTAEAGPYSAMTVPPPLPRLTASRYVQPLREGGSLPAVVDTEAGLFVAKFRGAGQGAGALVAELIVGRLATLLGLPVPDLALVQVTDDFGLGEGDPEIQHLLRSSHGTNMGLRYLDGAFNYDGFAASDLIPPDLAADTLVTNPDRTHRNPNLLVWERRPWLIDHGTALYVHHDWNGVDEARMRSPFPLVRNHVLLLRADDIQAADERLTARLSDELLGPRPTSCSSTPTSRPTRVSRPRPGDVTPSTCAPGC